MSLPCYSCIHFTSKGSVCELGYPCEDDEYYEYFGDEEEDDGELFTTIGVI